MSLTAREQLMLELINRGRADPKAEASRLGVGLNKDLSAGTIDSGAKQPLAPSFRLQAAAEDHSRWMLTTDTFSHTGANGSSPGDRIEDEGYNGWTWGENISWRGTTGPLDLEAMIVEQYEDLFESAGHRKNLMNGSFKEVGIAQETGGFKGYNTSMVTQDFGARSGTVFLVGVVIDDKDNDDFYDVGEGIGGVTVSATNGDQTWSTTTYGAGGYSLKLPAGSYNVVFEDDSGDHMTSVVVRSENVKLDIEVEDMQPALAAGGSPSGSTTSLFELVNQDGGSAFPAGFDGFDFGQFGPSSPTLLAQMLAGANQPGFDWSANLLGGAPQLPPGFGQFDGGDGGTPPWMTDQFQFLGNQQDGPRGFAFPDDFGPEALARLGVDVQGQTFSAEPRPGIAGEDLPWWTENFNGIYPGDDLIHA